MEIPRSDAVAFVVRDPESRFVSAFISRFRMGCPRNYNPWGAAEAKVFGEFRTANDLAEALDSETP